MNPRFRNVLLAAGVFVSVVTGCSDDTRVVTEKENGATIELAVGEHVRFELANAPNRQWQRNVATKPFILEERDARVEVGEGDKTPSLSEFEATGGGEQQLVFWERYYNQSGGTSSKFSWPAQKAAVAQTADGAYWASGVRTVQEPPDYHGYNQGHGLYIHE